MAADCSFFRSSTGFTVCLPFCTENGSGLLILPLVNGFPDGLRADFLSGWQCIARSSAHQRLSRFARLIAQRMVADCSYLHSSTAFTVCTPFCLANDNILLILPLVNGFHGLRALLFNGWQRIARSSARQRLSRFARRFAQRMTAHCSYFHSSKAFTTVCAPYCSADVSGLLILPLVKGFHGLRTVLHSEWQRIACSSARQRLSLLFARRIAQRMSADCSYFRWSKSFTVCTPDCSTDVSGLLIHPLFNGFPDGSRSVLLCGWYWIARTSARQRLSRRFTGRFAQQMAAPCSFFHSSKAFTVCAPDCSTDVSGLLIPPLFNGFPDGSRPVLLCGWHWIARTSARQRLS